MENQQNDKRGGSAIEDCEVSPKVPAQDDEVDAIENKGVLASLKRVFTWRNYAVYLFTSWIFSALTFGLDSFFNLYLRNIGWDYILIGVVASTSGVVAALARLVGGYVGDNYDRRSLSIVAMAMFSFHYLLIGITDFFIIVFISLYIYDLANIAKPGSTAFIMDNIPKSDSGFALSLFNAGRSFGIITLLVLSVLIPVFGFAPSFRLLYLFTGISLLVCTVVRDRLLVSGTGNGDRERESSLLRDFLSENANAARQLFSLVPGVFLVVIIDALSDDMFHFGALIYTNEVIGISINGITIMLLASLALSGPLILKVGRISDRIGVKRAGLTVYALMPISALLLVASSYVTFWAPVEIYILAESMWPGLGAVFTIPFVAIVLKYVNDLLWWVILITMIQKSLPRTDTAKMLAVFWFTVYVVRSIGPLFAAFVFQYSSPVLLFVVVFFMNLLILGLIHKGGLNVNGEEEPAVESEQS